MAHKESSILGNQKYRASDFLTGNHPIISKQKLTENSENALSPPEEQLKGPGPKFMEAPILGRDSIEDWKFPSLGTKNNLTSKQKFPFLTNMKDSAPQSRSQSLLPQNSNVYHMGRWADRQSIERSTEKASRVATKESFSKSFAGL